MPSTFAAPLRSVILGSLVSGLVGCSSSSSSATPDASSGAANDGGDVDASGADAGSAIDAADGGVDGASPGAQTEYTNGTRLRAKVYLGGAGAKVFSTWRDTTLDFDCAFATADDATLRCLPSTGQVLYADAACTTPIFQRAPCGPLPKVMASDNGVCVPPTVRRVGAPVAAPATVYEKQGTVCHSLGTPSRDPFFDASQIVPASALVQGNTTREPRGAHFAVDVVRTADGAVDARTVFKASGFRCAISAPYEDAPASCTPSALAFAFPNYYYADSACTKTAAVYGQGNCGGAPAAILAPVQATCAGGPLLYDEVGAAVTMPYHNVGTCQAEDPGRFFGQTFFAIGNPLPPSTFPAFIVATEGTDKVKAQTLSADDGARLAAVAFRDSARGVGCIPQTAADGQLRCLPRGASASYFKDAACTRPLYVVPRGCAAAATVSVQGAAAACTTSVHEWTTGALLPPSTVRYAPNGSGGCSAAGTTGDDIYDTGTEIPASDFGAVTLTQE